MTSFLSVEGGPIWIKFRRLVQNDMSTAVIWSKWRTYVEFQYGGRLGELHGMSSHSHVSHCRVLPLGEFTVMIPETYAYCRCSHLAKSMSWSCHIAGCNNSIRHIENRFFAVFYFIFGFYRASVTDARHRYNKSVRPSIRLSIRLSARYVPISDENSLTYRHSFFHHMVAQAQSF